MTYKCPARPSERKRAASQPCTSCARARAALDWLRRSAHARVCARRHRTMPNGAVRAPEAVKACMPLLGNEHGRAHEFGGPAPSAQKLRGARAAAFRTYSPAELCRYDCAPRLCFRCQPLQSVDLVAARACVQSETMPSRPLAAGAAACSPSPFGPRAAALLGGCLLRQNVPVKLPALKKQVVTQTAA